METNANCKNCEEILQGSFCHQCGQKLITERFTFKRIFRNLLANIFNIEKGFNYTLKQLFINPGQVARDYLNGKTVGYYHPFRYLFIWITISAIIMLYSGVYDAQTAEVGQQFSFGEVSEEQRARQQEIHEIMKKYMNLVPLFILPFMGLVAYWFYKRKGYNLAEHLIALSYFFAQATMVGIAVLPFYYFFPALLPYTLPLSILMLTLFFAYGYKGWLNVTTTEALMKGFFSVTLGYVLMFAVSMILTIIGVLIYVLVVKSFH